MNIGAVRAVQLWLEHVCEAMKDPAGFLERLAASAGPAAKKLAIAKLRSKLEPHLEQPLVPRLEKNLKLLVHLPLVPHLEKLVG